MEIVKETFSFNEFIEKLKEREKFSLELQKLFGDLEMIEIRIRDEKAVVYMLQLRESSPLLDVTIDRCKHVMAKFETIEGSFKLDTPLGTILKEIQKKAHETLEELDDEYLDTY